jgi:hypothetical protein
MICVIALIVFGVLSIFSATHRPLAREAFDCVFRKITFRKCNTNLDQRIKGDIVAKTMKRSPAFARFIHRWFAVLSWLFLIIFVLSLVQVGMSVYYYVEYDNCNGPNSNGYCVLNAIEVTEQGCGLPGCDGQNCSHGGVCTGECGCENGTICDHGSVAYVEK